MKRIISRSLWRKLLATFIAVVAFVWLYEVTTFDSRDAARPGAVDPTAPKAGSRLVFGATAYCKGTTTASGAAVRTGIAASDSSILPVGSVINVTTDDARYNGIYTIMDTGPKVQGRMLDVYIWSCDEALAFGRKQVQITVLRLGWNPQDSSPSLIDRLFRRREAGRNSAPPPVAAPFSGATVDHGATANDGASDGATVSDGASDGATSATVPPHVAPSNLAPSDAPVAPLGRIAPSSPAAPVLPAGERE